MAYRRTIITRASLLSRHRLTPLFPFTHSDVDRRQDPPPLHHHLFGTAVNSPLGFRPPQLTAHSFMLRSMSTAVGEGAQYMADVAEVLTDRTVEAVAVADGTAGAVVSAGPVVNEVAIAAADSAFPVAALQYLVDGVHNLTGFNCLPQFIGIFKTRMMMMMMMMMVIVATRRWVSIALTTLLIRGATVPLLINQLKSTTKLSLMRPQLEEIKQEMQDRSMDPKAVAEGQQRMQALFKQYGVTPLTPLKGLLFQGPVFVSFFFAISNMVEKVPSFKQGGVFWFTDLTTPDNLYIFPALTALSFWITVECNMQEGMEGNPAAKTMKNVSRFFAVATVPLTMNFPKAIFCYWVTSNIFSLMYGLVLKAPGVKKFLNIPEIPVAPPSTTTTPGRPELSFLDYMKKYIAAQKNVAAHHATSAHQAVSLPAETAKPAGNQKIPSSAVLSQKIRSLERQVKGRKSKKR